MTEQRVSTPVPLFATFEGGDPPARMRVFYKGVGAKIWAHADMKRSGDGFAVSLPCASTARVGQLVYFIQAEGSDDEIVAQEGTREAPKSVEIKRELEGEPPHLPDTRPPSACHETSEAAPQSNATSAARQNWFTFLVEQDLALVGSATGVCDENIQTTGGWSCFRPAGSQYHGNPKSNVGDVVNAGLAPATTRIHLGFDCVLAGGFVVGLHGGVVVRGGGPRPDGASSHPFFPAHLEMRAAYWFGSDVFSTAGFRPFVFASGGAAEVDTSFAVPVAEDRFEAAARRSDRQPEQAGPHRLARDGHRVRGRRPRRDDRDHARLRPPARCEVHALLPDRGERHRARGRTRGRLLRALQRT